jgi:hypothetical protein
MNCQSCHEQPATTTVLVGFHTTERWDDFCVSQNTIRCDKCEQIVDDHYGYEIARGSDHFKVCPSCLVGWAVDEKLAEIKVELEGWVS